MSCADLAPKLETNPISYGPPPEPKYWINEYIMFDRNSEEGKLAGKVSSIDIICDRLTEWTVRYYCEDIDDPTEEKCVLGPMVLGEKR